MNNLYYTIGLPRSGKSTFCRNWTAEKPNRVIVCADDIRLSFGHRFNEHIEEHISSIKHLMIRTLLRSHDVIVDGTHTTWSSIRKLLEINWKAEPYWIQQFSDPNSINYIELCEKRAIASNQPDLLPVISRMAKQQHQLECEYIYKIEAERTRAKEKTWHVV